MTCYTAKKSMVWPGRNMFSKTYVPIVLCILLLQACNLAPIPTASPEATLVISAESATKPTLMIPRPTATLVQTVTQQATATQQPTLGPTATVWPPVFNIGLLQDIRDLDSFIVTINEKNTVNGRLTELTNTIGYIKEPYRAYNHNAYPGGVDRIYVVDGWTYSSTGSGDWYISAGSNDDLFFKADIPAENTEKLVEAQFVGQEDYQGIPAYHFVLAPGASTQANTRLEGDFYLAQEGNYVLYSHWKETSSLENFTQVYEVTETLSSINKEVEINLPADMQKMVSAVELPAELGLPLPGNSELDEIIRYKNGIGVDLYYFTDPKISRDEFLDFYRQLQKTDGWGVWHVGHVNLHEADCEFTEECVMISKGNTQVILYFNGSRVRAEFDWTHLYAPL